MLRLHLRVTCGNLPAETKDVKIHVTECGPSECYPQLNVNIRIMDTQTGKKFTRRMRKHVTTRFLEGQNIELTGHPMYSPDLAPNDFYLFPSVKNKLRGQRFSNREEPADAFKMHVLEIPQSEWQTCYKTWYQRMQKASIIMMNILKSNKTISNDRWFVSFRYSGYTNSSPRIKTNVR
ncbi:hypothetical protein EVAR_66292_1 [Eumeta japonica]|uniref:Histone-lysine N-methyltransferase SETMAR n=1 Tax=Eumeta variegata TaxID=151549 RepID=A0A4C1YP67_EUMVA|nr:hypothetical protein EVAR_66292_1 [Eumeta japonica]